MENDPHDEAVGTAGPARSESSELEARARAEIERYRERGKLLRYAGTGSAIAGGASALLPLAITGLLLLPVLGFGGAGYALIKQQERDERIHRWEAKLRAILGNEDDSGRRKELLLLIGEIAGANA